jgi:spore coat polysaccharide biosynthesis protein SpsF (cytidylyltransferase family)
MKIPALISVRSSSTRLPNKCFLPFGDVTVVEHIIIRSRYYGLEPIICTTIEKEDDRIASIAKNANTKVFRGSVINKLQRWRDCCREFGIDAFHSVDADDPFFCGEEVKRSFSLLVKGIDMITPSPSSSNGGATVGYSLKSQIIEKACYNLDENTDTEMMWSYIERVDNLNKIILEDPDNFVIKNRMTLDYYEDYILLEAVRLMVGNLATREQVYKIIDKNPDLISINEFRSDEWAKGQKNKLIK